MAHELEIINGVASFAYNRNVGAPWHKLGTPIDGFSTAEEIVRAANADYTVKLTPVLYDMNAGEGDPIAVAHPDGFFVVGRVDHGVFTPFKQVHGGRYTVVQNLESVQHALDIVGASGGDSVMDTAGVLGLGERFFATVFLGECIIDPAGVNDRIGRYLMVTTSHDGTWALGYTMSDVRAVCANTVRLSMDSAISSVTFRHTPNYEARVAQAGQALGISTDWAKAFGAEAEKLLSIPMTEGRLERVVGKVPGWAKPDAGATDRKRANWDEMFADIVGRFHNAKNEGAVGANGWAAVNAIGEFLDHGDWLPGDDADLNRTIQSLDPQSLSTRRKLAAHKATLALV